MEEKKSPPGALKDLGGNETPVRSGSGRRRGRRIVEGSDVEFYSGHKVNESPRAIVLEGKRIEVTAVLGRKRVRDIRSDRDVDVFLCRLEDGETVSLESLEDGRWAIASKT
jgi:hypothetical protein